MGDTYIHKYLAKTILLKKYKYLLFRGCTKKTYCLCGHVRKGRNLNEERKKYFVEACLYLKCHFSRKTFLHQRLGHV